MKVSQVKNFEDRGLERIQYEMKLSLNAYNSVDDCFQWLEKGVCLPVDGWIMRNMRELLTTKEHLQLFKTIFETFFNFNEQYIHQTCIDFINVRQQKGDSLNIVIDDMRREFVETASDRNKTCKEMSKYYRERIAKLRSLKKLLKQTA